MIFARGNLLLFSRMVHIGVRAEIAAEAAPEDTSKTKVVNAQEEGVIRPSGGSAAVAEISKGL